MAAEVLISKVFVDSARYAKEFSEAPTAMKKSVGVLPSHLGEGFEKVLAECKSKGLVKILKADKFVKKATGFEEAVTKRTVINPDELVGRPAEELYDKASYMRTDEFWDSYQNRMKARIGERIAELIEKRDALFIYIKRDKNGQFAGGLLKREYQHDGQYQIIKDQLARLRSMLNT